MSSKHLSEVWRLSIQCPSCKEGTLELVEFIYDVPYFDKVLVSIGRCSKCGYRTFDTMNVEGRGYARFEVKVTGVEDLSALVVRSKTARVMMPELGVEVLPGPYAQPFISTIEGVLYRVLDVVAVCESESCKEAEERIRKAIDGKVEFTFMLEDPEGNSCVIHKDPSKVKVVREARETRS